jgi:hypothetical protein
MDQSNEFRRAMSIVSAEHGAECCVGAASAFTSCGHSASRALVSKVPPEETLERERIGRLEERDV